MQMDLKTLVDRPMLLLLGVIWISVHAALMLGMAKLIRAPLFFMAVGSQANIGGAASAPVVASAFHPSLAPVGVLLAVRSEEHTSELQSLMRNSYAVFCLKKKNN